jgi:hypothetical protein
MADMYGAVCSNGFTVKDVVKFKAWIETYHFGYEIELFISEQVRNVSFGGYEQYPSACPRRIDADGFTIDADLNAFAQELCEHLEPGEVFSVTAGGNEKLRYVSFDQLIIAQEHPNDPLYEHYSSDDGNDVLLKRLHGEELGSSTGHLAAAPELLEALQETYVLLEAFSCQRPTA